MESEELTERAETRPAEQDSRPECLTDDALLDQLRDLFGLLVERARGKDDPIGWLSASIKEALRYHLRALRFLGHTWMRVDVGPPLLQRQIHNEDYSLSGRLGEAGVDFQDLNGLCTHVLEKWNKKHRPVVCMGISIPKESICPSSLHEALSDEQGCFDASTLSLIPGVGEETERNEALIRALCTINALTNPQDPQWTRSFLAQCVLLGIHCKSVSR